MQETLEQVVSKTTGPGVYQYIRKYTPLGRGGTADVIWGKNRKWEREKGEIVKEKEETEKKEGRKGKENEKMGSKR